MRLDPPLKRIRHETKDKPFRPEDQEVSMWRLFEKLTLTSYSNSPYDDNGFSFDLT